MTQEGKRITRRLEGSRPGRGVALHSPLFTPAPVEESELLAGQGIDEPQGLSSLADPEWSDDEDGPYLAALLAK